MHGVFRFAEHQYDVLKEKNEQAKLYPFDFEFIEDLDLNFGTDLFQFGCGDAPYGNKNTTPNLILTSAPMQ